MPNPRRSSACDCTCVASMRESETFEQTVQRKERDRMHKVSIRELSLLLSHNLVTVQCHVFK